jgi:RecA-family ATPase
MAQNQTHLDSQSKPQHSNLTDQEQLDMKYEAIQKSIKQHDEIVDEWNPNEQEVFPVQGSVDNQIDTEVNDVNTVKGQLTSIVKNDYKENLCLSAEYLTSIAEDTIPHIWEPFFPKVGLVGICGASESGKSRIIRQLCLAICNNESDFLGSKLNLLHNSTLYISSEDNEISSGVNLKSQTFNYPKSLKKAKFGFNVTNPLEFIKREFRTSKFDLVVIDVWSDFFGDNPNNFAKVRENLNQYSQLASEFETCICIIHHNTKHSEGKDPSKTNLNGSQAIEAKLRTLLEVRTSSEHETMLSVVKGNYIPMDLKKNRLILNSTDKLNYNLKEIKVTGYQKAENKINKSENPLYIDRVKILLESGNTQDRIVEILKKEFGNDAPKKGTVNQMVQRLRNNQSVKI